MPRTHLSRWQWSPWSVRSWSVCRSLERRSWAGLRSSSGRNSMKLQLLSLNYKWLATIDLQLFATSLLHGNQRLHLLHQGSKQLLLICQLRSTRLDCLVRSPFMARRLHGITGRSTLGFGSRHDLLSSCAFFPYLVCQSIMAKFSILSLSSIRWSLQESLARCSPTPRHLQVLLGREVLLDRWFSSGRPFYAQVSREFGQ